MGKQFSRVAMIGILTMAATLMGKDAEDSGDSIVGKKPFGQNKAGLG